MAQRHSRREVLSHLGTLLAAGLASSALGCNFLSGGDSSSPARATSSSFDLVVLGATPAGIMAAAAALREGATVGIIERTHHVGGIVSSGLTATDAPSSQNIGGLPLQFFQSVGRHYGATTGTPLYRFEPHVAEASFERMLDSSNLTLLSGRTLASVVKSGTQIKSITLDNGAAISASQWIDASYEGDLLALAGVSYTLGRESQRQYGESLAGLRFIRWYPISPYTPDHLLLPGVNVDPQEAVGQADDKIMAYTFRLCLTTDRSNMAPFPMPPGYNPDRFLLTSGLLAQNEISGISSLLHFDPLYVRDKYCLNSMELGSIDYIGASWGYPNADWTRRASIFQDHFNYVAGLLYFLTNDSSVPSSVRIQMKRYGLPRDEFTDNQNWPWQMYVREGRRLQGRYVMKETDVTSNPNKTDSIGVGCFPVDSHACDQVATVQNGQPGVATNGWFSTANAAPAQLPFRCMLPQDSEVTNLAVPVCISSSRIAFCSLRVEPTYMILGEAAGTAAVLALQSGIDLSAVDVPSLQNKLRAYGAILDPVC